MPGPADRKPRFDRMKTLERSMRAIQDNVQRAGPAASASYTLTGGILLLGGLGYAADTWLKTSPWFFLTGLVVGIAAGFYALVMSTRRGKP
jgi:F0F1-type ATP synthase assembly protein I